MLSSSQTGTIKKAIAEGRFWHELIGLSLRKSTNGDNLLVIVFNKRGHIQQGSVHTIFLVADHLLLLTFFEDLLHPLVTKSFLHLKEATSHLQ